MYSKAGYLNDWKGDGLPDGSYYYIVKINELDKTYKGVLTIASPVISILFGASAVAFGLYLLSDLFKQKYKVK